LAIESLGNFEVPRSEYFHGSRSFLQLNDRQLFSDLVKRSFRRSSCSRSAISRRASASSARSRVQRLRFFDPRARAAVNATCAREITWRTAASSFLFRGGLEPPDLSDEEQMRCNRFNEPPEVEPIGTVVSREGLSLEFQVFALDPHDDPIEFRVDFGPDDLFVNADTGLCRWTPPAMR
jgi:hypothetical protein